MITQGITTFLLIIYCGFDLANIRKWEIIIGYNFFEIIRLKNDMRIKDKTYETIILSKNKFPQKINKNAE